MESGEKHGRGRGTSGGVHVTVPSEADAAAGNCAIHFSYAVSEDSDDEDSQAEFELVDMYDMRLAIDLAIAAVVPTLIAHMRT